MCYSKYESDNKPYMKLDPNCPNQIYDANIIEEYVVNALLEFAVEYKTETEYIAYTFSDDYVYSNNVGNYIVVYKTIMVKGENGR
jgi:hypothetical protein